MQKRGADLIFGTARLHDEGRHGEEVREVGDVRPLAGLRIVCASGDVDGAGETFGKGHVVLGSVRIFKI